jgi:small subunit ribosomal protein S1
MNSENLTESSLPVGQTPEPAATDAPQEVQAPASEPIPEPAPAQPLEATAAEAPAVDDESFADILSAFESSHKHRDKDDRKQLKGTVVSITADQVFLDIGYKTEGVLPRSDFENNAESVKLGDVFPVSVKGRNEERYYALTRFKVAQPRDWSALETAFAEKLAVVGTVTGVIKGGLHVDIGVRAFMPASRSGTKDAAELEKLVGTEITCRITKLDVTDEDVVVDRRVVLEEQARATIEARRGAMNEGDVLTGTVRSLVPYGAFVDLGGLDGLLHISDISWGHIGKPDEVLSVGQEIQVRILKIDRENGKISLGLKQLQPEPWQTVPERYQLGQRISGTVSRLTDFGAFVEIEPGIEGLIHISEMAWGKKVHHPREIVKQGDTVEAVILGIKPEERRIALGLKQALGDPWAEAQRKFLVGSEVQGPVTRLTNFGAFVEIAEGVEGLVHVSEIAPEKRINHPSDVLKAGQVVQALVLAVDMEKRQVKLSMKQLVPTSVDEYIAEHKAGNVVSGRVAEIADGLAQVELGAGIRATCRAREAAAAPAATEKSEGKADLSALTSMLQARWKGQSPAPSSKAEPLAAGQVRSFKIVKLDPDAKKIEVELA